MHLIVNNINYRKHQKCRNFSRELQGYADGNGRLHELTISCYKPVLKVRTQCLDQPHLILSLENLELVIGMHVHPRLGLGRTSLVASGKVPDVNDVTYDLCQGQVTLAIKYDLRIAEIIVEVPKVISTCLPCYHEILYSQFRVDAKT